MVKAMTNNAFTENAYLLFPIFDKRDNIQSRLNELTKLCESANVTVIGYDSQFIREINPSTVFGSGKLQNIKDNIVNFRIDVIIYDGNLSPARAHNLCNVFNGVKIIDRTALILDIFALHAKTNEGKLQVELAQLEYLLPRLRDQGKELSRLGGGVGTRGPGETKLETNRRYIRQRINSLKKSLDELKTHRTLVSDHRKKNGLPTVALAGYTNAGKSTLLNKLSGSNVLAEDKLFATLDPTARIVDLLGFSVIFIDTVGFIKDIPTNLIEAFKSTISSICDADLILNVCDACDDYINQFKVTDKLLSDLCPAVPVIKVYNKADKIVDFSNLPVDGIYISATNGNGIDKLLDKIKQILKTNYYFCNTKLSFERISEFYQVAQLTESYKFNYLNENVYIEFVIKKSNLQKISKHLDNIKIDDL